MKSVIFLLTLLLVGGSYSIAQDLTIFEDTTFKNGYLSFGIIKKDVTIASTTPNKLSVLRTITKSNSGISFEQISSFHIDSTLIQEKYQLYQNGVLLKGAEYVIHSDPSNIISIHGFFAPVEEVSFRKSTEQEKEQFANKALEYFNLNHQKEGDSKSSGGEIKKSAQIFYFDDLKGKFVPAYSAQIISKNGSDAENVFVGALDGQYLGSEGLVCKINFPGTAQTRYNGTANIVTDAATAGGPFRLQEIRNGVLIRTRNVNQRSDLLNVTELTDNDNNWTAAEHGIDQAGFDAHRGAELVFDYWRTVHNRNSINGSGMTVESYIHWDTGLPNGFNAAWHSLTNDIRYGDGIGGNNPLTSLDICGHEFGHGIDQYSGDLAYQKESGALDEGFADIWGETIEQWAYPGQPAGERWLIGENVFGGPLRNMANPPAFGQPNTYGVGTWVTPVGCTPLPGGPPGNDYCGVHTNSGVLNYWYFLISNGGNGTNGLGNVYTVTGFGINNAAILAYKTKLMLGTSSADFALTRSVSIQAARTLFGTNSCQEVAVTNAWFAVGVGAAYVGVPIPTITGTQKFCSGSQVYTVSPGTVTTWTPSIPTGVATFATAGNNLTLTKTASGHGFVNLTANIANACNSGFAAVATLSNIAVGFPTFTDTIVGTKIATPNGQHNYTLVLPSRYPSVSYNWWVTPSPGWSILTGQGTNTVKVKVNTVGGTVNVDLTACGVNRGKFATVAVGSGGGSPDFTDPGGSSSLRISPNPASNTAIISLMSSSIQRSSTKNGIQEIKITDKIGNLKRQLKFKGGLQSQTIDVSGLPTDVYTINVFDGITWRTSKIFVQ